MSEDQPKKETTQKIVEKRYDGARRDPSVTQLAAGPAAVESAPAPKPPPKEKSQSKSE
ncbi:MAG: hypothetical protein WCC94_09750 [Candidatus Bathyarchaeia archaeon]